MGSSKSSGSSDEAAFVIPAQGFAGAGDGSSSSSSSSSMVSPKKAGGSGDSSDKPSEKVVDASTVGTFSCLAAFLAMDEDVAGRVNMGHLRRALQSSPLIKV